MQYRAYLIRLKKDRLDNYIEAHKKEKIWKKLVKSMVKAGYREMIIFQLKQDVIIFEKADDLKKAYKFLNKDQISCRWEKMISEWTEIYPEYNELKQDIEYKEVPVLFYYENGNLLH